MDSLDDDANYVHIDDVKDGATYYCPCCKGVIKPRAYKEDIDYKVQPHFYHASGGCSPETYVHYICKTWLFDIGSKFIVGNTEYCVAHIDTEKTFHTSYGDYRPDMTIETIDGKLFYVEIKSTNKKSRDLVPKWDELGNDVVEIDVREVINQKYRCDTPTFKQIYSDGECFIKSYSHSDYDRLIEPRKKIWKRQEKINYKIQWEHLDWFWSSLSSFLMGDTKIENVIDAFDAMDIEDRLWCYQNLKGKSCVTIKDELAEHIIQYYIEQVQLLDKMLDDIHLFIDHVSPLVYVLHIRWNCMYLDYELFLEQTQRVHVRNKIITIDIRSVKDRISDFKNDLQKYRAKIQELSQLSELPYIQSINPISHLQAKTKSLDTLIFVVIYEDNIHNKSAKEIIGIEHVNLMDIQCADIEKLYECYKKDAYDKTKIELMESALKNNSLYNDACRTIKKECKQLNMPFVLKKTSYGAILHSPLWFGQDITLFDMTSDGNIFPFNQYGEIVINRFYHNIQEIKSIDKIMGIFLSQINQSKIWVLKQHQSIVSNDDPYEYQFVYRIYLYHGVHYDWQEFVLNRPYTESSVKAQVTQVMNHLASGIDGRIRLLEERK